uniref:Uncharacterized protein n=1 Tax=Anguilla anguilla TaxID=7936 RepID=A0A0E9UUE5_ANGAN
MIIYFRFSKVDFLERLIVF